MLKKWIMHGQVVHKHSSPSPAIPLSLLLLTQYVTHEETLFEEGENSQNLIAVENSSKGK